MKHFKDVHLVLEESEWYNEGDGVKVILETSDSEEYDYSISIDALSEGGYSGCGCTISLKNLLYKIKDIIPSEWFSDIMEDKRDEK